MPFPIFRRNIQQPATPTAPAAAAALSAGIAQSAAAPVQQTAALSILGNPTTATTTATSLTLTSGITFSGTTSVGIAPFGITTGVLNTASVTYAKIQTESASTLLGNPTTVSATVSEITLGTGLAFSGSMLISTVTGGGSGTVTQIDTGTGLTGGPITASGTVSITTSGVTTSLIADAAVTYAKIQSVGASRLIGNPTTASATASEISLGVGLSFSGTTIVATTGSGSASAVTLIQEVVTSASQTYVTFSSITNAFRDLMVRLRGRCDAAGGNKDRVVQVRVNGDTGSNYISTAAFIQNGSSGQVGGGAATTSLQMAFIPSGASVTSYCGQTIITIADYRGTTFFKNICSNGGEMKSTASNEQNAQIADGLWLSTSAITSVTIYFDSGNFVDNSVVSLYGHL